METWRDIEGYEGIYQVSDLGNVRSLDRELADGRKLKGKPRKSVLDKDGYPRVSLHKNGKQRNFLIHRLVAQAFIPNPDNKPEVNHTQGVKTDNRVSELEWCTSKENTEHAMKTGLLSLAGEGNVHAKLTEEDVQHIRWLAAEGVKQSVLAREGGMVQSSISAIVTGRRWSHV